MNYIDLTVTPTTQKTLGKLYNGKDETFRGKSDHGETRPTMFHCTTDPQFVIEFKGVDPRRVDGSILRRYDPITVHITFGQMFFDHSNDGPSGPDWKAYPIGHNPRQNIFYCAALVYGNANVTPQPLSVRMYFGKPKQTADSFRKELLSLMASNER